MTKLNFEYFCSLCSAEITSIQERRKKELANKLFSSVRKFFERSNLIYEQRVFLQWHLSQMEQSDPLRNAGLAAFLNSGSSYRAEQAEKLLNKNTIDVPIPTPEQVEEVLSNKARNYFITAEQGEQLLNKKTLYLCENHLETIEKSLVKWYCTNCGEEYSQEERKQFEFRFVTMCSYVHCRNCKEFAIAMQLGVNPRVIKSSKICLDCKNRIPYDRKEIKKVRQANPIPVILNCPNCEGKHLQSIDVVKLLWSRKKKIPF